MKMNTANALGFLLLGTVFQTLPLMGLGAHETQTLWLQLMGLVTGAIGTGYLLRIAASEVSIALSRLALRRAEAREQFEEGARAQQALSLGVRVTF